VLAPKRPSLVTVRWPACRLAAAQSVLQLNFALLSGELTTNELIPSDRFAEPHDELATLPHPPTRRPARLSVAEFRGTAAQGTLSTRTSGAHTDT